ncbi:MAG TPA: LLM class flavin-dependent oxidoreductase [Pseudonocardia sp.]|jgi:alkanesulfonate monooxygenase SsuD/methylene tetrahydromethanopterin reductase-like flavin-dependent oxidoreductase (luciferase family)
MAEPPTTGSPSSAELHLAVALEGTGWHPASWREPGARPGELLTAGYWTDLVLEAERGLLDLVTFEDTLGLQSAHPFQPDDRTDQVRGRLDSVLLASRIAPLTSSIGLIPTLVVTHTEPFHASKAIATLDYVSSGRAGVRVRVSGRPDEAALFGRREVERLRPDDPNIDDPDSPITELFDEATDYVEVIRRLWDSWEDDAEIRDAATGRFVDREKLHYIDFHGSHFSVRGPSITPRPPQGQPIVSALGHRLIPYRLIGRSADLGFITPRAADDARSIVAGIRREQAGAGRAGESVHVFGDLLVFLDDDAATAAARRQRLDEVAGAELRSDARIFTGSAAELADLILDWHGADLSGVRLRPAVNAHDLPRITRDLVPELQRRGAFRTRYEADTLRGLLGLTRPANRYAA